MTVAVVDSDDDNVVVVVVVVVVLDVVDCCGGSLINVEMFLLKLLKSSSSADRNDCWCTALLDNREKLLKSSIMSCVSLGLAGSRSNAAIFVASPMMGLDNFFKLGE